MIRKYGRVRKKGKDKRDNVYRVMGRKQMGQK